MTYRERLIEEGRQLGYQELQRERELRKTSEGLVTLNGSELNTINAEIAQREAEIAQIDAEIAKRDVEIAKRDAEIAKRDAEIERLQAELLSHGVTINIS